MRFTMARPEVSCHPETLLPGARSVISAALCYYGDEGEREAGEGRLPRYTWFDAYADLREKLDELGRRLGGTYRVLVDENDHVDREGAARAGVGFYGKNTMLITRRHGSWVVLGTLVTDVEVERSEPLELDCGACTLCIEACPTGALDEPGVLDSTRCLSYWTQAPGPIPEEYRAAAWRPGLRLRHLPGRLPMEPRRREAPRGGAAARACGTARLARRVARARRRRAARALRPPLLPAERSTLPAPKRAGRTWKHRRPRTPSRGRGLCRRRRSALARARGVGPDQARRGP